MDFLSDPFLLAFPTPGNPHGRPLARRDRLPAAWYGPPPRGARPDPRPMHPPPGHRLPLPVCPSIILIKLKLFS